MDATDCNGQIEIGREQDRALTTASVARRGARARCCVTLYGRYYGARRERRT